MKINLNKKQAFITTMLISAFSFLVLMGCSKNDNDDDTPDPVTYGTFGDASGSQVNPAVATSGTGRMAGSYETNTKKWDYSIEWTSMTDAATAIEIHGPAILGVNADLLFPVLITGGSTNGAKSASVTLTEQQELDLLAGKYYYTVITGAHPGGEVRGQIIAVTR